eukprot:TRINITY_DN16174_c0_g1_i1.p1 TRINITY_DN16174_c0_g1~~TRINITY_DN16174_c0_g1_i1.p1  ORF type:complete len:303 (-),score=9.96 TRINITY_DN16174_c0_g1_i1:127-1035(-)
MKVGVAQVGTPQFDLEKTIKKLEEYVIHASKENVELLVFPEAFIGGYPRHSTFGASIGERTQEGRDEFTRYYHGSILVPGPETDVIGNIAKENNVFLVIGVIEKEEESGTLYCSAIFVDPIKGYISKHRKLMPTAIEKIIWGCGDGSTLSVVTGPKNTKVSASICWENYMPLMRYNYYKQGVQIYCAPTVDGREIWTSSMTHIAVEGRCFVLSANQFTRQKDYPDGHPLPEPKDPNSILISGGSVIISPFGNILAGPLREKEGLLTADIDLDDVVRGKFDLDVVGHYSRPDIFNLTVNNKKC